MSNFIPVGAVGVFVAVLFYSLVCLFLSTVFACMLWKYGERMTYVSLLTAVLSISTLASIIQQIFYAIQWQHIKEVEWIRSKDPSDHTKLTLGGIVVPVDKALFWTQYYIYNVASLLVAFWASELFISSWDIKSDFLYRHPRATWIINRVLIIVFPAIFIALVNIPAIASDKALFFIFTNLIMLVSFTIGSILLILVLYKYMHIRRLAAIRENRSNWWQQDTDTSTTSGMPSPSRKASIYDRALITRFTIGFAMLFIFSMASIFFQLEAISNYQSGATANAPDFSLHRAVVDLVLFIPGVTASLIVFLVFGTTKSWKKYRELFWKQKKKVVCLEAVYDRLTTPVAPASSGEGEVVALGEARELSLRNSETVSAPAKYEVVGIGAPHGAEGEKGSYGSEATVKDRAVVN